LSGIFPLIQENFSLTDTAAATLQTFAKIAHAIAFMVMWLCGDFLPKKRTFVISLALWIILSLSLTLVKSNQFWLFVLLRSLLTGVTEVFSVLITVLLAEQFTVTSLPILQDMTYFRQIYPLSV
ncbi:hypothetical protein PMAYCL1PPCAC_05550, partial [Pristionchus mayeri]